MKWTNKRRINLAAAGLLVLLAGFWARRALPERSNAIPPSGGESFRMPAIPTPHYLQRDPRWENDTIGGTSERLARVGCTVCSLAMALDHYGVTTTPKELNDFLKQNDGYTIRGWLKWNSVSNFTNAEVAMDYIGKPSFIRIDRALKDGQPVIAKVFINGIVPHWVLIIGKEQSEYLMRDPLDETRTVKRLSFYQSKIYAIRTLRVGH
jgi:hypothetical protein